MIHFKQAPIDRDVLIIASGSSKDEISYLNYERLKEKYYIISINFVNNIIPNMRVWSDVRVSRYWDNYYKNHHKDCCFVTRPTAFTEPLDIKKRIDYWFNDDEENFRDGKWTLFWLIQLLREYFPEKKVYINGMDCINDLQLKIDTKHQLTEKSSPSQKRHVIGLVNALNSLRNDKPEYLEGVYNLSANSEVKSIPFMDVFELIKDVR